MPPKPDCDIGLIGLAVMGENLALNIASRGFRIAVYNRTTSVTDAFTAGRGSQRGIVGCHTLEDLVAALAPPRKVMMMIKAGPAVDAVIGQLLPLLSPGDVIIDGATRSSATPSGGRRRSRRRACSTSAPGFPAARRAPSRARA